MKIITNSGIKIKRKEIELDKKTRIFFLADYLETQKGMFYH